MNTFEVSHFTWWNADRAVDRACFAGRLTTPAGIAIARGTVRTTGVDYFGATTTSCADGRFSVFARASSSVELRGSVVSENLLLAGAYRPLVSGPASDVCLDIGDVLVNPDDAIGCVRGIVQNVGVGVSGIGVAAYNNARTVVGTSGAQGAFCLDVPVGAVLDITATGRVGAASVRGLKRGQATSTGNARCATVDAVCADAGVVDVDVLTCIAGNVSGENGAIVGATVVADGARTFNGAVSGVTGDYCLVVEQDDVVDLVAVKNSGLGSVTAEATDVFTLNDAVSCDAPQNCQRQDLVVDNLSCLRGETTSSDGAVLGGVVVAASPRSGGRARTVVSGSDGSFCVPVASTEVDVTFTRQERTQSFFARMTVTPDSGVAACSSTGCTDVGEIALTSRSNAGCLTARLVDGGTERPYNDTASLLFQGAAIAAIKPRQDGRFCLDTSLASGLKLADPVPSAGCVRREANIDDVLALAGDALVLGGSCTVEAGCTDVGELDFEDFCATS